MLLVLVFKRTALRDEDNIPDELSPSGSLGSLQKLLALFLNSN